MWREQFKTYGPRHGGVIFYFFNSIEKGKLKRYNGEGISDGGDGMSSEHKEIINRLRRVEGQIKGLQKMIEEEKDCSDILVQVAAARSAINKVGTMIFEAHFRDCLDKAMAKGDMDDFVHSFTQLMDRYVK